MSPSLRWVLGGWTHPQGPTGLLWRRWSCSRFKSLLGQEVTEAPGALSGEGPQQWLAGAGSGRHPALLTMACLVGPVPTPWGIRAFPDQSGHCPPQLQQPPLTCWDGSPVRAPAEKDPPHRARLCGASGLDEGVPADTTGRLPTGGLEHGLGGTW